MFPSGYFSIPYSVTGVGISDPTTAPLVGDQSQIVDSDRTRLKRLRPGTNVTLASTDDAITISSLGGGGDGTSSVLTLNNPATTPLDGDVSLRYDGQSVKRLRPGSSRITCVDQSDCVVLDTPVLAYTKSESDAKYRTILGSYDNTQVYNRTESDSKYRTVADSYPKTDVYTKTECTDVFLQKVNEKAVVATGTSDDGESVVQDDHILKRLKGTGTVTVTSEANRLVINGTASSTVDAYTKTESDSKYRTVVDSYTKNECDTTFLKTQTIPTSGGDEVTNGYSLIESDFVLRRLKGGTNITITPSENQLLITGSETSITSAGIDTDGVSILKNNHVLKRLKAGTNVTLTSETDNIVINVPVTTPLSGYTMIPLMKEYAPWYTNSVRDGANITSWGTVITADNTSATKLYSYDSGVNAAMGDTFWTDGGGAFTYRAVAENGGNTPLGTTYYIQTTSSSRLVALTANTDVFKLGTWIFIAWRLTEIYNPFLCRGFIPQGSTALSLAGYPSTARSWMLTKTTEAQDGVPDTTPRFKIILFADGESETQGWKFILPDYPQCRVLTQTKRSICALYMGTTGGKIIINNSPLISFTYATEFVKHTDSTTVSMPVAITDIGGATSIPQTIGGVYYSSGFKNFNAIQLFTIQVYIGDIADISVQYIYENIKRKYNMQYSGYGIA
jgi:hypothetical protein